MVLKQNISEMLLLDRYFTLIHPMKVKPSINV